MNEVRVTKADSHVHIESPRLVQPMALPFQGRNGHQTMVACLPAKEAIAVLDITEDDPPVAIMAMSVGHMGICAGYNSETLSTLINGLNTMLEELRELEKNHAQKL